MDGWTDITHDGLDAKDGREPGEMEREEDGKIGGGVELVFFIEHNAWLQQLAALVARLAHTGHPISHLTAGEDTFPLLSVLVSQCVCSKPHLALSVSDKAIT